MPIQFRCDQCSHTLAIGTHKAGSTIHCPVCLAMVTVPPDAADAAWWQDAALPPTKPDALPNTPAESWLMKTAPAPATPVAFTAPRPSAVPPPARKPSEPPPARKPVAKPSNRLPALAALGGGFALLVLAGTLTVLALPKQQPQSEGPGGEGNAAQLVSNAVVRPIEAIAVESKPVEPKSVAPAPPEVVTPPEVVPPPVAPVEKEKVTPPAPPAEKETPPPPAPVEVKPPVVAPPAPKPAAKIVVKRRSDRSEDELVKHLKNVPTISLDRTPARADSNAAIQAARLAAVKGQTNTHPSLKLLARRDDLAGLPLRRGEECRLTPSATNHLDSGSLALRTALASTAADPSRLSTTLAADKAQFNKWQKPEAVPALMQMLMAEAQTVREVLVDQLTRIEGKPATEALAQLAVFDLESRIREQAIIALEKRPVKDYRDILLNGFDHPWPAVADNAAEAVVALKLPDAVPALLSQLDKPDPQAPYEKPGSKTKYVKEMVRVNHFLNCLMCHPASTSTTDKVRGLVPTLDKPIPSGVAYYSAPQGQFVRADITYLKQDFSTVLPVEKPGLWPRQQRFDFVVRERYAKPADLEAGVARKSAGPTPHQKATFFALRELTGQDPGPTAEDWKKLTLGRKLDVRLRSRGFGAARAVAVDDEGRAYVAAGSHILRQEGTAKPESWLTAAGDAKWVGLTFDGRGRMLAARSTPADVCRIDRDTKAVTSLASRVGDKPLVGPRRMAVDKNEGIFFGEEPTDAKTGGIYYVSALGSVSKTASGPGRVRGLDLSPDGKTLYAALGTSPKVWAFPVESAGTLGKGRVLGRLASHGESKGAAVGLAVDGRGLVYVINGPTQQIEVFGPEGASLARTRLDEPPVACALGGEGGRTLYVLTATSLYAVKLSAAAKVTASRLNGPLLGEHPMPPLTRREMLLRAGGGLGGIALAQMLAEGASRADLNGGIHHRAKARRVIQLFMNGGVSQMDTFDHKPLLDRQHDKPFDPGEKVEAVTSTPGKVMKCPFPFRQHGQSGRWVSSVFPHVAKCVDDLAFVFGLASKTNVHGPASYMMNTGFTLPGFPCLGAWISYGLGAISENLPRFVVLPDAKGLPYNNLGNFSPGFLPALHQGTVLKPNDPTPIHALRPPASAKYITPAAEVDGLDLLRSLNADHAGQHPGDTRLDARIAAYEVAARMQSAAPEALDLERESRKLRAAYGLDEPATAPFGRNCLTARRLLERGVRFVQVWSGAGGPSNNWDNHSNIPTELPSIARSVDRPIAALLADLKARGLLDDTLVVWCSEFGRQPFSQGSVGRDHNGGAGVAWLAGAGIRGGSAAGASDEWGWRSPKPLWSYDLHATILHLLGIDHTRLTFRHNGSDRRLTDVHGHVMDGLLA